MIEVQSVVGGKVRDVAYADDPEAAVAAARQLLVDAELAGCSTQLSRARFVVADRLVRECRYRELSL